MTEEDMKLVALAALHGARFYRLKDTPLWSTEGSSIRKWSIARAAAYYLREHGLMSNAAFQDHDVRTDCGKVEELPPELLAQFGVTEHGGPVQTTEELTDVADNTPTN